MRPSNLAVRSHANVLRPEGAWSEAHAISALAALAQPTRLAIFRLLVKHQPAGVAAGVIAEAIGAPQNTLSSHLAIMVRASLLRSMRDGRSIIYRADVDGMRAIVTFLIRDCCNGQPELCSLIAGDVARASCAPKPAKLKASAAKRNESRLAR